MMNRAILLFLTTSALFCGCSAKDETRTLIFDQNTESRAQVSGSISDIIVEISDDSISLPEGYRLERVIPEDPEFEERHRATGLHRWYFVCRDEDIPLTRAEGELTSIPGVFHFERVPRSIPDGIPFNDPYAYRQWHLFNDGTRLSKFKADMDINVVPVWNHFTGGSSNVIVGVVDTGVQADHPDLKGVVIPAGSNGSKSFLTSTSSNPYDITPQRHGTHVAGLIAAINGNGAGVCGIAGGKNGSGGVRILDIQAIAADEGDSGNVYSGIIWAADHGAVILNNSWNSTYDSEDQVPSSPSYFIKLALDYFISHAGTDSNGNQTGPMKGGMVFFSAGNKSWTKSQPSMYDAVFAIGALGPAGESSTYTNYGDWVDLCAPGGNASGYSNTTDPQIFSTMVGSGYYQMQGTSQAAPCASGVAALIVSYFGGPGFTPTRLKEILVNGADREVMKIHSRYIGPMIDAYGSFAYASGAQLTPVTEITGKQTPENTLVINWKMNTYGPLNFYRNVLAVSEDESLLQNLDPFNIPSGVLTREIKGRSRTAGETVTEEFNLELDKDWYYTVVSNNRHLDYTKGNKVGKVHLRHNVSPVVTSHLANYAVLDHHMKKSYTATYSDADGDVLEFIFDGGSPAGVWQDDGAGNLTFNIDGNGGPAGTYYASADITDGICTVRINMTYTILPNNQPVARQEGSISAPIRYLESAGVTFYCSDSDKDELKVTTDPGSPAGTWTDEGEGVYRLDIRGDAAPAGAYIASITVDDGFGGITSQTIDYTLVGNTAPELVSEFAPMLVSIGNTKRLDLGDYYRDKEGDALTFSMVSAPDHVSASVDGRYLEFRANSVGVGQITFSASDGIAPPVKTSFIVSAHSSGTNIAEIYPVQVDDKLTIQGVSGGSLDVKIYNSTGRCVYSNTIKADPYAPYVINVSGLAPGRYTVILTGSKGTVKKSILKI